MAPVGSRGVRALRGRLCRAGGGIEPGDDLGKNLRQTEGARQGHGDASHALADVRGDPMIGEFGDAQVLRKFGDVPDDLSGL